MPIIKSIESLPRHSQVDGSPPSSQAFFAEALAQSWHDSEHARAARSDLDHAVPEAGPWRGSYGNLRCDRALYYGMKGVPETEPPGLADVWRFGLGHKVHEMLQDVLTEMYPEAETEVDVDLRSAGVPGSAHADVVINHEHDSKKMKLVVEVKTKNGYAFKTRATRWHGPPQGPEIGELIQAGFTAEAVEADGIIILYLALENVGAQWAVNWTDTDASRFAAEWHYSVAEIKDLLDAERARIKRMMSVVENDQAKVPPRILTADGEAPTGAEIQDPANGMWVKLESPTSRTIEDTGSTWRCAYCRWQGQCMSDGA